MKRITYVSSKAGTVTKKDLQDISEVSLRNNSAHGITGLLISAHGYFFQFLEGDEGAVDRLLQCIQKDSRHDHLMILKTEERIERRMFPEWSMRTIRLDETNDAILQPIRSMLESITQSHRIIEQYTQPSVLKFITEGTNPLDIPVRKTEKIVLFGDMVGFSCLSEQFPVEEVVEIVNEFLEICSQDIVAHGGEIAKYIGDCVMAHFAPDHADQAVEACLGVLTKVRNIRESKGRSRLSRLMYCGFGLSKGLVIQGNIGSSIKLDYTVLGHTVNLAARLESLTRTIGLGIALTESVKASTRADWPFVNVGKFTFKGQADEINVYSISHQDVANLPSHRQFIERLRQLR